MSVRFDPERESLVFSDDSVAAVDHDTEWPTLDPQQLTLTTVGQLAKALAEFVSAPGYYESRTWRLEVETTANRPPSLHEHIALYLAPDHDIVEVVVASDVPRYADEDLEEALPGLLVPIADRWAAELTIGYDVCSAGQLAVHARLDSNRRAEDLLVLGDELRAMLVACDAGQLTLMSAHDLVVVGHAAALVRTTESSWFDAKSHPYRLTEDRQKWELAKDVAAFANASGGLILIPVTTVQDGGRERVDEVKTLDRRLVDEKQYRDTIARWVYPSPTEVEVTFVPSRDDLARGQLLVFVPPQADDRKPFLVRGDAQDTRVFSKGITVPLRDGEHVRYEDIGYVHAALRAARRENVAGDAILERIHLDALPPSLRQVFFAARQAGLDAQLYSGGFRILLPGELPLDIRTVDLHPKTHELAVHTTMQRLAKHGVPTRTTQRGMLVPELRAV